MLDKRVVLITGGAGNMGTVTAKKYAEMGDAVVLTDMDEEKGKAREAEFCADGKEVLFLRADISREEECIALVDKVMETYGRIDVLCNNAGRMSFCRDFLEMDLAEFTGILNVNLVAQFTLTKLVAKTPPRFSQRPPAGDSRTGTAHTAWPDVPSSVSPAQSLALEWLSSSFCRSF